MLRLKTAQLLSRSVILESNLTTTGGKRRAAGEAGWSHDEDRRFHCCWTLMMKLALTFSALPRSSKPQHRQSQQTACVSPLRLAAPPSIRRHPSQPPPTACVPTSRCVTPFLSTSLLLPPIHQTEPATSLRSTESFLMDFQLAVTFSFA